MILQKPCQENFEKFQEYSESKFGSSEKDRYFLKILKWQHKLVRDYKRGMLVSYFLNNAAKTCLYGLKISENIEIEHIFQSKAFFHLSGNLHTSCFSVFKLNFCSLLNLKTLSIRDGDKSLLTLCISAAKMNKFAEITTVIVASALIYLLELLRFSETSQPNVNLLSILTNNSFSQSLFLILKSPTITLGS